MKGLHSLVWLNAAFFVLLSGCSDVHSKIDASSDTAFDDSVADLLDSVPETQKRYFELGLVRLRQQHEREALDGMDAEEILQVEIDHLRGVLQSRIDKREKFEGYAEEFRSDGKEAPENILRSLEEVSVEIRQVESRIAEASGETVAR